MKIKVLAFGQLAEMIGSSSIELPLPANTNELKEQLNKQYPQLSKMNYAMAINKLLIHENQLIAADAVIALLPPFSGG